MKEGSSYKWIVLGNIMIGTFMAVLDSTVVNTGLPVIMGTLGADINVAEWVLTGYMLSMASILPAAGWLSERFGKDLFLILACLYSRLLHVWKFVHYRRTYFLAGDRRFWMWHAPSRRYGYCERCIPARTTGDGIGILVYRFRRFGLFWSYHWWIPG